MTRLAIVIVSFNARDDLARTLQSLHDASPAVPHGIVVVDNASTDGAPAMLRARLPGLPDIQAGAHLVFAAARHRGIHSKTR